MNCREFHNRWQLLLDERRLPEEDASLAAHADQCEVCAELLRLQSYMFRELKRARRTSAVRPQRLSVLQVTGISLAIAGSLLVLAIPAWRTSFSQVARRGSISVAFTDPGPLHRETAASHPSESGMATRSVPASEIAREHEALRQLMEIAARWPVVPDPPKQHLDGITGGFRSFADSLGGAWNALRSTFPSGNSQPAPGKQAIFGWPAPPEAAV